MDLSDFVEALLSVESDDMPPEETVLAYLGAVCCMVENVYGKNCAKMLCKTAIAVLECRSECTRVVRACCPNDSCDCYQRMMRFLNSWGIEPSLGVDDEGHYAEYSIPTRWSMRKRERFLKQLQMEATQNDEE